MNFVEELKWRGMIHTMMPGTEDLLEKEQVTAYLGIDPTADSLHIGHLCGVMMLKHFQRCGHKPLALIGGATGMIGDPSGKSQERNLLDEETLRHNVACIKQQLARFLDFDSDAPNHAELVNNYDWMKDYSFLNVDDLNNSNYKVKLEGYLFPDTYFLEKNDSLDDITRVLLDRFDVMYKENKKAFDQSDLSIHRIISLASVVQFEASEPGDMAKIAGVFYNRLDQGMKLQSSVTVCYALYDDFNDPKDCETNPEVDSPYNTYLHEGLPIGPILNPGDEAIKAVLNPKKTDYLFFAADIYNKVDGKVHYTKTYEEHLEECEKLGLNL